MIKSGNLHSNLPYINSLLFTEWREMYSFQLATAQTSDNIHVKYARNRQYSLSMLAPGKAEACKKRSRELAELTPDKDPLKREKSTPLESDEEIAEPQTPGLSADLNNLKMADDMMEHSGGTKGTKLKFKITIYEYRHGKQNGDSGAGDP